MNPEQREVIEGQRIVLMAKLDCLLAAREKARERGDAETFLAVYNQWSDGWDELRKLERPLYRLVAEERKRRNPPDDPLGV